VFCHKLVTSMNGKFNGSCSYAFGETCHTNYIIRMDEQKDGRTNILDY
jgi:hypothetical protein